MINIAPLAVADMPAARQLYLASFPLEEQRPWCQIVTPRSGLKAFGIYDSAARFTGLVTLWEFACFVYVEHFAVDASRRGQGIGASAMAALQKQYGKPVVLEVEPPDSPDPMAARRIGFYRRIGFSLLDFDYIQPPYSAGLPPVPLRLMCTDPSLDAAEIGRVLHLKVYGVDD